MPQAPLLAISDAIEELLMVNFFRRLFGIRSKMVLATLPANMTDSGRCVFGAGMKKIHFTQHAPK